MGRTVSLSVLLFLAGVLIGSPASATGWRHDLIPLSELQDGGMFLSGSGDLKFSDFEFSGVGVDGSLFDHFFVKPLADGFKLVVGLGDFCDESSIEMTYTVTAAQGLAIDKARLLFFALAFPVKSQLEVAWDGSNGVGMLASDAKGLLRFGSDHEVFDPVASIVVDQLLSLGRGWALAKVENSYRTVELPEAGTGALLAAGLLALVSRRRR